MFFISDVIRLESIHNTCKFQRWDRYLKTSQMNPTAKVCEEIVLRFFSLRKEERKKRKSNSIISLISLRLWTFWHRPFRAQTTLVQFGWNLFDANAGRENAATMGRKYEISFTGGNGECKLIKEDSSQL